MFPDLANLLREWPFSDADNVRRITAPDGREYIQIRVDQGAFQGLMQMELTGRPDGSRPHDRDYALDHFRDEAARTGGEFVLPHEDCEELFEESRRIYERYVFLLQLSDYDRVVADTERNMELFRFVNRHAVKVEDRMHLEKWWPYVLRLHGVARAMGLARSEALDAAMEVVVETRERIEGLKEVDAVEFHEERRRSLEALEALASELQRRRPLSLAERLKAELEAAVENEEFERAASLRDRLSEMPG